MKTGYLHSHCIALIKYSVQHNNQHKHRKKNRGPVAAKISFNKKAH